MIQEGAELWNRSYLTGIRLKREKKKKKGGLCLPQKKPPVVAKV